jgi:hypothetical protein
MIFTGVKNDHKTQDITSYFCPFPHDVIVTLDSSFNAVYNKQNIGIYSRSKVTCNNSVIRRAYFSAMQT